MKLSIKHHAPRRHEPRTRLRRRSKPHAVLMLTAPPTLRSSERFSAPYACRSCRRHLQFKQSQLYVMGSLVTLAGFALGVILTHTGTLAPAMVAVLVGLVIGVAATSMVLARDGRR